MGLPKIIKIPCHDVLSNQNTLKLKKGAPIKQFFNINLGIGIIKKTTLFVRIFDISPCVFTQISIGRARWMLLTSPTTPKTKIHEKTWWWHHHHIFSCISCFWGSRVCYSWFYHSRWITLVWPFPCPSADSLDPFDHFLSFDVSLTIPKNMCKFLYATFKPLIAYIRGFDH